ncbi:exodeoxyribonuclease VII large subunit [Caballeronia hypogeia]|uniref:Exodeoxyribonuclease VII large subunit n=1 Tax=Caballeronia hypogeia TaxID=1777140 RepID=A0A158CIK1_9BURK|nr:exodeoxyribonuclease VII large subunit [Caballeronia hypogeia]SAK82149.1 exodeoxyribonuclease VII large subunit [Caballeronia hypogeia]
MARPAAGDVPGPTDTNLNLVTTYLEVPFKEKDEAKALGARWDAGERKWYVPEGTDVALFSAWLPVSTKTANSASVPTSQRAPSLESAGRDVALPKKGVTLSQLLASVAQAVAQSFRSGVWTIVEVVETRVRNGHVYLELSERSTDGSLLATARAIIWANIANRILPEFERATGASIAPGIKLLVRAKPNFKPQYGFSIEIDAIDPDYTLGDLEARKREIRSRLQQEGIFDANKKLPAPWDFNAILVIAPQEAAGLGDFRAEAKRLERFGVCRFVYASSRFQGEGAAREIRDALLNALADWDESGNASPDAVVIIRGGGAVNDLAWLNDYELAKTICCLRVPVLTGVGHERDSTIIDEVANTRFDTPSKVAAGIEQVIKRRVDESRVNFEFVTAHATRVGNAARVLLDKGFTAIQSGAIRQVGTARQTTSALIGELQLGANLTVRDAKHDAGTLMTDIEHKAYQLLAMAKRDVPSAFAGISGGAGNVVKTARALTTTRLEAIHDRTSLDVRRSKESIEQGLQSVALSAQHQIASARNRATAVFREVAGQGPEKTLGRGFAIVRDQRGQPVTSAADAKSMVELEIELRDGRVAVGVKQGW